jgi:hypothetical protein
MEIGEIIYRAGFFKDSWDVCYEKHKTGWSSAIFHNFEHARIFSELVQIKENGKRNKANNKC